MKLKRISLSMPKGYSKLIHASVILLTLFGLFMIISATTTKDVTSSQKIAGVIIKEIGFIAISYFVMVFAARNFRMRTVDKYYLWLVVFTIVMLLIPLAFSATSGSNTRAWIRLGPITLQPSEFAKISVFLIMAHATGDKKNPKFKAMDLLLHPLAVIGIIIFIVVFLQKDFGTGLIILGISVFCGLVPAHRSLARIQKWVFGLALLTLFLMFFSVTDFGIHFMQYLHIPDYMIKRFFVSYNPFYDIYDSSRQIFNGLAAFVQGGLFGVGYGKGFLKYSYIFAADTDMILAVIVEEMGIVLGFLPLMLGYATIVYELMKNMFKTVSEKDKIILMGTIGYIFFHYFLNVGGVTAMIPLTGVPLLLVSAGGSSRLAIMLALGICQHVIARNQVARLKEKEIS